MNILKPLLKLVTFFSLFICAFMFTLPANAASREITPAVNNTPVQLAYYYRGHRYYHYNHGYHRGYYHRYHHGYHRHYRYHHHYHRH